MIPAHRRILVAVDTPDVAIARSLIRSLAGKVGGYKIGLELFVTAGPSIVEEIRGQGDEVFLDLKFHDIPNTVAGAAAAAGRLGVSYFTMHATGGPAMLRRGTDAAADAATAAGFAPPIALAVTVLTSHDEAELTAIGLSGPCASAVERLGTMAREAGVGGLVCSPLEISALRRVHPSGLLVVPGIRPATAAVQGDDQSRTAGPRQAIEDGADRLVIGRPITKAQDPGTAAEAIAAEIEAPVSGR